MHLDDFIIRIILAILVASFPPLCIMGNGYVFIAVSFTGVPPKTQI